MKLKTKSDRCIFLTTNIPPKKTNGSIGRLPTHQLADRLSEIAVMATANAAGLKICFLSMAMMYLEAMASTDAQNKNEIPVKSCNEVIGVIIRVRISAVMSVDSRFAGAANTLEKIKFVAKQKNVTMIADTTKLSGFNLKNPKQLSMYAAQKRKSK